MNITQHESNNGVATAPPGVPIEHIRPAPYTFAQDKILGPCILTFWRPDKEELEALNKGALVMLTMASLNVCPHKIEVIK